MNDLFIFLWFIPTIYYSIKLLRFLKQIYVPPPKFRVGDEVIILDKMNDSMMYTGNHMPYTGIIKQRHWNFTFKYKYYIKSLDPLDSELLLFEVYEHSLKNIDE